tara:strand:- start:447 stop:731 length:285 start_codon:yes stop_codon:yes gene_type:complete
MSITTVRLAAPADLKILARELRRVGKAAAGVARVRLGRGSQRGFLHFSIGFEASPSDRAVVAEWMRLNGYVCGIDSAPCARSYDWTVRPVHAGR